MRYNGRWSAGLNGEAKQNFENLLAVNNKVLDRLVEICYNMLDELEDKSSDFDTPNWALRQANLIGQAEALKKIIALCKPAEERDPVHSEERTMTNGRRNR
jgi:hypothetical protein